MLALAFTNDCVETTCTQSPKTKGRHSQLTQHSSTSDCIQLNAKWEMGKQTTEVTSEHTVMSVFEEVLLLKRARKKMIHLCTQTKWFQTFAVEYFDVSRSGIASSCLEFNVRLTNLGSRVLPTYPPSNFCTPCATRMSAAGQCMLQKTPLRDTVQYIDWATWSNSNPAFAGLCRTNPTRVHLSTQRSRCCYPKKKKKKHRTSREFLNLCHWDLFWL